MLSSAATSTAGKAVTAAVATAGVATVSWYNSNSSSTKSSQSEALGSSSSSVSSEVAFQIEAHLLDKIRNKSYLQNAKNNIPSTLRILAVDLPEMRSTAFKNGICRLSHDKIFVDDIAPPKSVVLEELEDITTTIAPASTTTTTTTDNKQNHIEKQPKQQQKKQTLKISQKALIKSLVNCQSTESQQRVGVELLEASVENLNVYQLRKIHQVGNVKYDPGKYYGRKNAKEHKKAVVRVERNVVVDDDDEMDEANDDDSDNVLVENSTHQYEIEAPWNQYAWIEELRLRIGGKVSWGSAMEKSSRIDRVLFGNAYRTTIPSSRRTWEGILPSFMQSDPAGVDGKQKTNCWNSNKPHAVIANGAALQRVPSSLRLLQKFCKESDVPLFVIHDPRVWGGNTQQNLSEALREMRRTIKNRIISQTLKQQGSMAFTRGRLVGQIETEAKWYAKDQKRKARKFFTVGGGEQRTKSEGAKDWRQLDAPALERKLVERGVIERKRSEKGTRFYTPAMVNIARQCVEDETGRRQTKEEEAADSSSPSSSSNNPQQPQTTDEVSSGRGGSQTLNV